MLKFTERLEEGICGTVVTLENGIELYPNEWNGEVYVVNGKGVERVFKSIQMPISFDDGGVPDQWECIGFEEI